MVIGELLPVQIETLNKSQFKFYLTGSRYFGNATATSDWDFFVQDSPMVRKWLESEGYWHGTKFNEEDPHYVDDFMTVLYQCGNVHIQVIQYVDWKYRTQVFLKNFPWNTVEKNHRDRVWNWAKYQTMERMDTAI